MKFIRIPFSRPNFPKINLDRSLIIVILIAFFIGGLSGALTGFYAGTLSSGNIPSFLGPNFFQLKKPGQESAPPLTGPSSKQLMPKETQEESAVISAVKKISPSVVSIVVSKYVSRYYGPESFFPEDFFEFSFPFGFRFQIPQPKQEQKKRETRNRRGYWFCDLFG